MCDFAWLQTAYTDAVSAGEDCILASPESSHCRWRGLHPRLPGKFSLPLARIVSSPPRKVLTAAGEDCILASPESSHCRWRGLYPRLPGKFSLPLARIVSSPSRNVQVIVDFTIRADRGVRPSNLPTRKQTTGFRVRPNAINLSLLAQLSLHQTTYLFRQVSPDLPRYFRKPQQSILYQTYHRCCE